MEFKTQYSKHYHGNEGRSYYKKDDQEYQVITIKRFSGNVVTIANKINPVGNGMIEIGRLIHSINHGKIRATKNGIIKMHELALNQIVKEE